MYDAAVDRKYETHGGGDVAIYARGPMEHLFKGVHQQNFVAHAMMYAACLGPNQELCEEGPQFPGCPSNESSAAVKAFGSLTMVLVITIVLFH